LADPEQESQFMSDVFVATGAARRRLGMAMLVTSVMVLAVATQVGPATAQTTPPPPTLTKTVLVAGDNVGVSGSSCVAGTQVQVQLDSVTLVTATSTATGTYSTVLVVPKSATPGAHPVTVVCTGPNGTVTATGTITVSATAATGFSPRPAILVATILLVLGGACLLVTNRRRPQPAKVRSR
jgi:hypothetical protein